MAAVQWGNPDDPGYQRQSIVILDIHGVKFGVNTAVAGQFAGFLNDLWDRGYRFKSVQGYNNRTIAGSTKKSNHAYGAAIDIDPDRNPQYKGTPGKYALPPDVGQLAAKYGLFWGGNYKTSKDYMHFEAVGAPATPANTTVQDNGGGAHGTSAPTPAASGTGGTTVAGDTTALPANATPQQIADAVSRDFGYLAAFLSDPEIGPILRRAALEDWDESRLMGALSKTNFWKKNSATTRQWDALNKTDHATAKAQVDARIADINARAAKAGLVIGGLRVHDMAVNSLRFGWTDQQMTDALMHEGKLDLSGKKPNDALSIKGNLRERANQYLVPIADSALDKWTVDVVSGKVSQEAFDAYLREQAKSMFPSMGAAIDSGVTVAQYVDPYKQIAADTLGLAPDAINFNDPKWNRALFQIDSKGQRSAMSLAQWGETLRTDPTYGYSKTAQAKDQASRLTEGILTAFGKVAS